MEKQNEKKELKLREIKAPQNYYKEIINNSTRSGWSGGAGTGSDDCMLWENFSILCRNNALKSKVFVCGYGWLTPKDCPNSSSSSSSSSSGSSSSSSGERIDLVIKESDTPPYGWKGWSEWSGWNDFSGSEWNYSESSGYIDNTKKIEILKELTKDERVRIQSYFDNCADFTNYINGEIVVCDSFFTFNEGAQRSILWHEFYHVDSGHYYMADRYEKKRTVRHVILRPEGDLLKCVEKILQKDKVSPETFQASWKRETEFDLVHTAQWYDLERRTYEAELRNGFSKGERYLCIMRWNLWKCYVLASVATIPNS